MDSEESMTVRMLIFDLSPSKTHPHLNILVKNGPTKGPGTLDDGDDPRSSNFTFKWIRGVKQFTITEVKNEEIVQEGDEIYRHGQQWPENKVKPLLSIGKEQFTSGGFGGIWQGITNRGVKVAVKKMKIKPSKATIPPEAIMAGAYFEAAIASAFNHKNVIELIAIVPQVGNPPWLVFQLMERGSLRKLLEQKELIEDKHKLHITRGIVDGMVYLHDKLFIHRDLNPRNILIDADYTPKIADFGLSAFLDGQFSDYTTFSKESGYSGDNFRRNHYSLKYCAPEVLPVPLVLTKSEEDEVDYEAIADFLEFDEQIFQNIDEWWQDDEEDDSGDHDDFKDALPAAHVSNDEQDVVLSNQISAANYMTTDPQPTSNRQTSEAKPNPPELVSKEMKKQETSILGAEGKYSLASDVWSFGLILHEIWTYDESTLYSNYTYQKIKKKLQNCPKDITYSSLFKDHYIKTRTKDNSQVKSVCTNNPCVICDEVPLVDQEMYPRIVEILEKIFKHDAEERPAFTEITEMLLY